MVRFYFRIAAFSFGVLLGVLIANICIIWQYERLNVPAKKQIPSYKTWSMNQGLKRELLPWDKLRYDTTRIYHTESLFLFTHIQVFCILFVRNKKNFFGATNTWMRGCNNQLVIEIKGKNNTYSVIKRTKENSSWVLLCKTLANISDKYDWYMIANDNTFVILENLRYFVAPFNSSGKYYFGYPVKFWNTPYNLGQAGYVLSKGSLKAAQFILSETECSTTPYWNREDFYLGKFLLKLNITPSDTRDDEKLSRFHPYNWYTTFFRGDSNRYYSNSIYPVKCCSKWAITFEATEGSKMFTYYYLLYSLQVFNGGSLGNRKSHTNISDDMVWKQFLKERNIIVDNISSQEYYNEWIKLIDDPTSFAANMKKDFFSDND